MKKVTEITFLHCLKKKTTHYIYNVCVCNVDVTEKSIGLFKK